MTKQLPPTPEFSRPLIVDRVPRKGSHEVFAAEAAECNALAARFALPNVYSINAHLVATPWRGGGLRVNGSFDVDLEQTSVVSLENFRTTRKYLVERYYLPPKATIDGVEEDADPIVNGLVDLGELVAETLGLELEPYPRKLGEDFKSAEPEIAPSPPKPVSPFARLSKPAKK
ncbi:MAG: DUF177 domain-containing protein [Alphaproteobacteria bacterium]|nr:DUF177 domain-containing protein [Alphaproteobacteria bacterium]